MQTSAQLIQSAISSHQAGRLQEAEQRYKQVLRVDPRHPDALHLLGVIAYQIGNSNAALHFMNEAIEVIGPNPLIFNNIGVAQQAVGLFDEAIQNFQRAIQLRSDYVEAHFNLGRNYQFQGNNDAAEASYRRVLTIDPHHPPTHTNLGNLLQEQGKLEETMAEFRAAICTDPRCVEAHFNLGNALQEAGNYEAAIASFRKAIFLKPDFAEAFNNLGSVYRNQSDLDTALTYFRAAQKLRSDYPQAHNNLASVLQAQGRLDEAIGHYRESLRLQPACWATHSNMLVALNYAPQFTPEVSLAAHRQWASQHATQQAPQHYHDHGRDPDRRLRIGYTSADFRTHPVAYFLLPLLTLHNHRAFEITCYSDVTRPDGTTARMQDCADRWRSVRGWDDDKLAEAIRDDQIDILIDLAGHTAGNRLRVFARKPAPIQVSFLGYPNTTGLETIDYRLTDTIADPPGEPVCHTEELFRLNGPFCCYATPDLTPDVAPLPALRTGMVTFGSLHTLSKLNDGVLDCWSQILKAVPQARLLIARTTLTPSLHEYFTQRFVQRGISSDRFELRQIPTEQGEYFKVYTDIDLVLDTFPWSGHTTTCEAAWMGVPTVTLRGDRHAGRMSASLLTHLGLDNFIAETPASYVSLAAEWARNLDQVAPLRAKLRSILQASSLCDARGYATNVEAVLRTMWHRWCRK